MKNHDEYLYIGRQLLDAQPFSKFVGAKLTTFNEGEAVLEIPIKENLLQQNGFVHGGVLSYAADNALTFTGGSVLGTHVLTSEYKINYVRPAIGESLIATGLVVYAGKRQAVCRCDVEVIKNGEKKLCATAQGTIVTFDPSLKI
ncbi:PaaI family thioesterase [Virgibacillus dokdonensis]|uniref:Medium/long-chain acyl-CoA thioesterase YigI n=1 Tax=Virgibacillus dokdonensis TaxID=302167 RepID=A0A2K9IWH0_9BACI|nr:PaaI family thioesterase [Virgibacillus dokdonensis]AUJ24116.1 Acyl-coenzyme A thioesterase PaaI [Virgibacillus dokdonensis]